MLNFAVWDIFYYVWLKVLINWPESLFTWDILFLVPIVWAGPVLAPLICSITMLLFAGIILYLDNKGYPIEMKLNERVMLILGTLLIFCTYIWDYAKLAYQVNGTNQNLQTLIANYTPIHFNWIPFIFGELLILTAISLFCRRTLRAN